MKFVLIIAAGIAASILNAINFVRAYNDNQAWLSIALLLLFSLVLSITIKNIFKLFKSI